MLGEKEKALSHDLPNMIEEARFNCHFALHMAECFALIDERDSSFEYRTLAVENGVANRRFLEDYDKLLDDLKEDDRFDALMARADEIREAILSPL